MASRMITAMAPAARSCSAVTGLRSAVNPTTIRPRRRRMSASEVDRARMAITSRGGGDVEPALAGDAVLAGTESDHDVAEGPVVHVQHPAPGDVLGVDAELVALVEVVVEHGGEGVVGGGDRMHVAGQVEVERLERRGLAVAAAGGASLDPEGGTHRRLSDGGRGPGADVGHALGQTDGGGGLAFAQRGRGDGRHHHVLGLRSVGQVGDGIELDLGHELAVGLEQIGGDPGLGGDGGDRLEGCLASDVEGGQLTVPGPIRRRRSSSPGLHRVPWSPLARQPGWVRRWHLRSGPKQCRGPTHRS